MFKKHLVLLLSLFILSCPYFFSPLVSSVAATGTAFEITVENSPASQSPAPQPDEATEPSESSTGAITWITGQNYIVGEVDELVLKIDYPANRFEKLLLNGRRLAEGEDFFLEEGSTVIELSPKFLASLTEVDTYQLAVYYNDGAVAETNFLISATAPETPENPTTQEPATTPETTTSSAATPNTGRFYYRLTPSRVFTPPLLGLIIITTLLGLAFLNRFRLHKFFVKLHRSTSSVASRLFSAVRSFCHSIRSLSASSSRPQKSSLTLSRLKFIPIFSGAFLAVFGLLFVAFSLGLVRANHDSNAASESLELNISDSILKQTADLSSGSVSFTLSQDISVKNSTSQGYLLYLSSSSNEYNELSLGGAEDTTDVIATVSGRPDSPAALSSNSYGYTTSADNPSIASQIWSGVPTNKAPNLLKSSYSATQANDTTTVTYGFNLSGDLSDGTYKGSNDSSVVYTAIANPDPVYSVTYSCNGGTKTDADSTNSVTKKYGEDLTLSSGDNCLRTKYLISSWNTKEDGSGASYPLGGTFTENTNVVLYAIWEKDPAAIPEQTFALKYDAGGGTGAPVSESHTATATSYTFTISSKVPTRAGYTFAHWTLTSDTSDTPHAPGTSLTVTDASTTLLAAWEKNAATNPEDDPVAEPVEEYTITFNYVCQNSAVSKSQIIAYGDMITMPDVSICDDDGLDARTLYAWNTKDDASGDYYALGKILLPTSDMTFYGLYKKDEPEEPEESTVFDCKAYFYTVRPDGKRGDFGMSLDASRNGVCAVLTPPAEPDPTLPGTEFVGWSDESCSDAWCTQHSVGTRVSWTPDPNDTSSYVKTFLATFRDPREELVQEIKLSGNSTLLMNHSKTMALNTTVLPETAANKSVTYASSDKTIATVSSKGVVTAKTPGEVTITATAKDGSGVKGTFKLKITQKVIIVTGPSSIVRISDKNFANVQEYTDASSGNYYSIADGTLMFAALGGTGFKYQTLWASGEMGDGWRKINQYVRSYDDKKEYLTFYIFFNIASAATTNNYTCSDFLISSPYISEWAADYDRSIKSLTSSNYDAVGIVMSELVLEPSNPNRRSLIVSNTDSRRCNTGKRSNYKINRANASFYAVIKNNYPDLHFRQVFKDIVDTSDHTKDYPYKSGWEDYHTTDGIHFDNPTAIKYFNAMLNKYGAL